jgi:hypothetical protein
MRQFSLALALLALLSLGSAALAEDKPIAPAKDQRVVEGLGQPSHPGDLQPSGLYLGPDGVLHNVPKSQDPRLRIY